MLYVYAPLRDMTSSTEPRYMYCIGVREEASHGDM